jgi:tRNA isopentenyl-2-thiomethyl-A-37 hydroxylase MiaE
VIDVMPDYITIRNNETGTAEYVEVVQIWVDPNYPEAHRDPALRAYIERRSHEGVAALIRWDNTEGMVIFAPAMSGDRRWHEVTQALSSEQHSLADVVKALGAA